MMFAALLPILAPLLGDVIKRVIPNKEAQQAAELEIHRALMSRSAELENAAASIVKAEAESKHWLTASWRPITMLVFVFIIANNYIIAPYSGALFGLDIRLDIPPDMWDLLKIGIGGYVLGRSAEKGIETWRSAGK